MNQCPIFVPQPTGIPLVPAQVKADIPPVPLPSPDQPSGMGMGGTTVPQESSYMGYHNPFDLHRIHQVSPPHAQNSDTPCSTIDPMEVEDPNNEPRSCYQILDPVQGMVGRVCNRVGADEAVDKGYNNSEQDGEFVRGNEFGWNYSRKKIEDRPKYVYVTPGQKQIYKQQVSLNPFFPYEGYERDQKAWVPDPAAGYPEFPKSPRSGRTFKTYPHLPSYVNGKPDWIDDQVGTRKGARTGWVELEGFTVEQNNTSFWVLLSVLVMSWIWMSR